MMMALSALLFLLPSSSRAVGLSVMEQTKTSRNTIFISTKSAMVGISTQSYNGGIPNVGLYSSSNVVVSATSSNSCVLYATGTANCLSFVGGGSGLSGVSNTSWTIVNQFTTTSPTYGVCGASVTLTTGANPVKVTFSGNAANSTGGGQQGLAVLCDGAFCGRQSTTSGVVSARNEGASDILNMGFTYFVKSLGAGAHVFCLSANASNTGTTTVCAGQGSDAAPDCALGAEELK